MSAAGQLNTVYPTPLGPMSISGHGQDPISLLGDSSLNIRVVPASNGYVISIREDKYSHTASKADLHIVPEDQDLGTVLGQLITLHYLKK